ncbi:MAG: hypothetical protein L7F78_12800 [Syntrophales bacterium LBB04]|nr:hypothetical protein [Syntrophales bacterium LBB04]
MKMQEIREIAMKWEIPYRVGLSKEFLIREIQKREGNTPCFRANAECPGTGCLWMEDCINS